MFIRWIVRGHKNADVAKVSFHDAYLVESYRDENGNPRQRTVSYLGNIREMDGEFPTIERELFLIRAELILESLSDLSPHDVEQTMTQLQERVPPLNKDEVMTGFRNNLRWYCLWWKEHGGMPTKHELLKQIEIAQETTQDLLLNE